MININPRRLPGEKFKTYRERLKHAHAAIKQYLRGQMVHPSSTIVVIPVLGADAQADAAVIDGKYRDVVDVKLKDGKEMRIGRTKGVSFRHSSPRRRHGQGRLRRAGIPKTGTIVPNSAPSLRERIAAALT